jgi:exodeoxyribonuclease VII large subunit
MVADAECRTPTEAGSRVVPRKSDLLKQLAERDRRLAREQAQRVSRETERLAGRRQRLLQVLPNLVRAREQRLIRARADVARLSPVQQLARRSEALVDRGRRIDAAAAMRLNRGRTQLASRRAEDRIERAVLARFANATRGLEHRRERLIALSPDSVLSRGYSITQDAETGAVLHAATDTGPGRQVRIRLASGRVGARVEETER